MSETGLAQKKRGRPSKPIATVPLTVPAHILAHLNPPALPSQPSTHDTANARTNAPSPLNSSPVPISDSDFEDSSRRREKLSASERQGMLFDVLDKLVGTWEFDSLAEFLQILFYHHRKSKGRDPRGDSHKGAVSRFLSGNASLRMSSFIQMLYDHPSSRPRYDSPRHYEKELASSPSPTLLPGDFCYAAPSLFTWACHIVAKACHKQIQGLAKPDPDDPNDAIRLRASTNGRNSKTRAVSWKDVYAFDVGTLSTRYMDRAGVCYFLVQSMCARKDKLTNLPAHTIRRPYTHSLVSAISSFVACRNQYATGTYALPMGIYHFATKTHVDETRIAARTGHSVSTTTVRKALRSMTGSSLATLRSSVAASIADGQGPGWCMTPDNVQEYGKAYEYGVGRDNKLICGTFATAVRLYDCPRGAWDLEPYIASVIKNDRKLMTVRSLNEEIDWDHVKRVSIAHIARVLIEFLPSLQPLRKEISNHFRINLRKRSIPLRKTEVQPLGTNDAKEIETKGMIDALQDFDSQMGLGPEAAKSFITWVRGDGGSHASVLRGQKYNARVPENYDAGRHRLSTPELWHTRATMLNQIAETHQGPATSSDPSSLSRAYNRAGFKIPSNVKSCDFYPTVRSMTTVFESQVLDCWRIHFKVSDLCQHFETLKGAGTLPNLEHLLSSAKTVYSKYFTQQAYKRALSSTKYDKAPTQERTSKGTVWMLDNSATNIASAPPVNDDTVLDVPDSPPDAPVAHSEAEGFDGDRVLANSILFKADFVLWLEMAYALPEGDIGRVWEILKIWIIHFAGGSHNNYVSYLLDVYCLMRYEASQGLQDAIFNNWLVNLRGELGHWIEGDLLQEHYNKWVEDMIRKHGGSFNDPFYRMTISPNVHHFLRLKESICSSYGLERRSLSHTSPHLRAEYRNILALYRDEELHFFRSGRSHGHAAKNSFEIGYAALEESKLDDYLLKTSERAQVLSELSALNTRSEIVDDQDRSARSSTNPTNSSPDSCPTNAAINEKETERHSDSSESDASSDTDSNRPPSSLSNRSSEDSQDDHLEAPDMDMRPGSDNAAHMVAEDGVLVLQFDSEDDDGSESEPEDEESSESEDDGSESE